MNFHRQFIFVHSTSFRHSLVSEVNFNYKKNFFFQIQFFFFSTLTDVQSSRNKKHFERSAIIVLFEKSAIVRKKNNDFSRELKALIFSFHMNNLNFVDDIYYTLMRRCKSEIDAIALRCQIL